RSSRALCWRCSSTSSRGARRRGSSTVTPSTRPTESARRAASSRSLTEPADELFVVRRREAAVRKREIVLGPRNDDDLDLVAARRSPGLDARLDRRPRVGVAVEEQRRHPHLGEGWPRVEVHLFDPEAHALLVQEGG